MTVTSARPSKNGKPHTRRPAPRPLRRAKPPEPDSGDSGVGGPEKGMAPSASTSGVSAADGRFKGIGGPVGEACRYHADYMVMPARTVVMLALWEQAAHFIGEGDDIGPWDTFPIAAVTSPEMGCGKSTLLDQISEVAPRSELGKLINPSEAHLFRTIESHRPTMVMDESERFTGGQLDPFRSLMNASIRWDAKTGRCAKVKDDHEPRTYSIYCPKVLALIGDLDPVLNDRCLPVRLERKADEPVRQFRGKAAREEGQKVRAAMAEWAVVNRAAVEKVYDGLTPFRLRNHRRADLLMPLQAVATVLGGGALAELEAYARDLEAQDREAEQNSPRVRLLAAVRELFAEQHPASAPPAGSLTAAIHAKSEPLVQSQGGQPFIRTGALLAALCKREEEPWKEWSHGRPLSAEKLAGLLRPFGIRSARTPDQKQSGYYLASFRDAWGRYLPPAPAAGPTNPASAPRRPAGYDAMIRTERWATYAEAVRRHWGNRCAICNGDGPLEVHHRTYERLGKETMTDCIPVCGEPCHAFADRVRKETKEAGS